MTTPLVLGIDFGTCRTSAAVLIGDDIHPVRLGANAYDEGKDMPTAVFMDGDGQFLVGEDAVRSALRAPSSFVKEFKLRIGGRGKVAIGRQELSWSDLVAAVLRRVKLAAEAQCNNDAPIAHVVIAVPTLYVEGGDAWKTMEDAARHAGFQEVRLVREPHAAAIHYDALLREGSDAALPDGEITLVYDLGGGTFDPALIRRQGGEYRILGAVLGDEGVRCGGVFFDEKIREDFAAKCPQVMAQVALPPEQTEDTPARRKIVRDRQSLETFLQKAKWSLSEPQGNVFQDADPVLLEDYRLTREEFHAMISPLLDATLECCDSLVRRSEVEWKDIARILMVGGSCHIPLVRKKLESYAKNQGSSPEICWRRIGTTDRYYDPLYAVSLGAAWAGRALVADLFLREADDFWKKESWDKSSPLLQKAAEYGNAKAQRLWAESLECGLGVEQNLSEAATWYRKSASQGDAEARFALGYLLERGEGVERNEHEALELYRQASEQGHAGAMFRAGLILSPFEPRESHHSLIRAADSGHLIASSLRGKESGSKRIARHSSRNGTDGITVETLRTINGIPWNPLVTYGNVVDPRDGHKYRTITIGKRIWMAENLAYKVEQSWVYADKDENQKKYGRLYNYEGAKSACLPGWRLPNEFEIDSFFAQNALGAVAVSNAVQSVQRELIGGTLGLFIGSQFGIGSPLLGFPKVTNVFSKQLGVFFAGNVEMAKPSLHSSDGWIDALLDKSDILGFRALPGGYRDAQGKYQGQRSAAFFWTSSPKTIEVNGVASIKYSLLRFITHDLLHGYSVRCVKDSP